MGARVAAWILTRTRAGWYRSHNRALARLRARHAALARLVQLAPFQTWPHRSYPFVSYTPKPSRIRRRAHPTVPPATPRTRFLATGERQPLPKPPTARQPLLCHHDAHDGWTKKATSRRFGPHLKKSTR